MNIYINARKAVLHFLPKNSIGAEIGVFKGDYSKQLYAIAAPQKLFLVDPWANKLGDTYQKSMYSNNSVNNMNEIYTNVCNEFTKPKYKNNVDVLRIESKEFFEKISDELLDFIYIDGDHNYPGISEDLRLSYPKVKKHGLICIDDYTNKNWWKDDVINAVNEFIAAKKVIIKFAMDSQVVLQKNE
jgi:hypothetical protein